MAKKYDPEVHIAELIHNATFMRAKLEETRKEMETMDIIIPYDNGGGQSGTRENPAFPAYEKLMKCYQSTLKQIQDMTGQAVAPQQAQVLQLVGNSKWKRA